MKLLEYIELQKQNIFSAASRATEVKLRQFCDSISAFPKAKNADLRLIQSSDFIFSYGVFLHNDYEKKYSITICNECVEKLRVVLRYAIRHKAVANYDPIPTVISNLRKTIWHSSEQTQEPKQIDMHLSAEVSQLAKNISWAFASRNNSQESIDAKEARRLRDEMTEARASAIYLFGVLFLGLDIKASITLPNTENNNVFVEKYGKNLLLPATAMELVHMHNCGKICSNSKYLFKVVGKNDTAEQIEAKAKSIERKAKLRIKRLGLSLFGHASIFDEWLSLAGERGADRGAIEEAISASVRGTLSELHSYTLESINEKAAPELTPLKQQWYVLCSYSPRLRGKEMRQRLAKSGIFTHEEDALRRLYNPMDANNEKSESRHSIERFLFFRATPFEAMIIDRHFNNASLLKCKGDKTFATVLQSEIEFLQVALRDFRDDIELIDRRTWMKLHEAELVKQSKVTIHEGPFKGRTANIIDVKHKKGQETIYIVQLSHDIFSIKATRAALSLDTVRLCQ